MIKNYRQLLRNKTNILLLCVFAALALLVISPTVYIESVKRGLELFFVSVVPSLFPFFFLTKLLTGISAANPSKRRGVMMRRLFGLPPCSGYVFLLSALSGYPIGAKMISDFYERGELTYEEAKSMTAFCNTSGPFFVIGTVGVTMFHQAKIGYLLLGCHLLAALICGLIFSGATRRSPKSREGFRPVLPHPNPAILSESVYDAVVSICMVGGFVTVFYMLGDMLLMTGILKPLGSLFSLFMPEEIADGFLFGLIEVTRGCKLLSQTPISALSVFFTAFIISFGGLSIGLQALGYLGKCKIKARTYLFYKMIHALIAATLSVGIYLLFGQFFITA